MKPSRSRLHITIWLVVAALFLGAANDGWAGQNKKKKKKKRKAQAESSETAAEQGGAPAALLPAMPRVAKDIDKRLLAYDTAGARELLSDQSIDSDLNLQVAEGRVLAQEGRTAEASSRLSSVADAASDDPAPLVYMGEAYLLANDSGAANKAFAGAERRARAILQTEPEDRDALLHLGVALQRQKRFGDAISTLEQARAADPRSAVVAYQLGATHAFSKNWNAAIDMLTEAIGLNAGMAYAYYYRGLSAGEIGRKDLMVNDLDRFLAMAPNAPEAPQVKRILGGL